MTLLFDMETNSFGLSKSFHAVAEVSRGTVT